jgi:hypothetical protein
MVDVFAIQERTFWNMKNLNFKCVDIIIIKGLRLKEEK